MHLRVHEVLDVAPEDVHNTDIGTILRVHQGQGDTYRETPLPCPLATTSPSVARLGRVERPRDVPRSHKRLVVAVSLDHRAKPQANSKVHPSAP